jgi:hypothetical protein
MFPSIIETPIRFLVKCGRGVGNLSDIQLFSDQRSDALAKRSEASLSVAQMWPPKSCQLNLAREIRSKMQENALPSVGNVDENGNGDLWVSEER